jgi:tetratricopeptide (TPR) repeat protein
MSAPCVRAIFSLLFLLLIGSWSVAEEDSEAEKILQEFKAIKKAGKHEVAHELLRISMRDYQAKVKEQPESTAARGALLAMQSEADDYAGMLANLDARLALHPQHADSHAFKAYALVQLQKLKEAEESYRKAIELEPKNVNLRIIYAGALCNAGRRQEAAAIAREVHKMDALNPAPYLIGAAIGYETGQFGVWNLYSRKAILLSPEDRDLRDNFLSVRSKAESIYDKLYQFRMEGAKKDPNMAKTAAEQEAPQVLFNFYPEENVAMRKEGTLAESETALSVYLSRGKKMDPVGVLVLPLTYDQARIAAIQVFEGKRKPLAD